MTALFVEASVRGLRPFSLADLLRVFIGLGGFNLGNSAYLIFFYGFEVFSLFSTSNCILVLFNDLTDTYGSGTFLLKDDLRVTYAAFY